MIIKEAVYKTCKSCGSRRLIKDSVMCCDNCKKVLNENYLNSTVFKKDGSEADQYYFCSWRCFFLKIQKIKCDYFIDMPLLNYDNSGVPASDFWKYIKKVR